MQRTRMPCFFGAVQEDTFMIRTEKRFAYVSFLIGFFSLFFFNGRWIVPIAAFLAPFFLIRFLRSQKPFRGYLILVVAMWVSHIFVWRGMMPVSGFFYYFLMLMMSVTGALPYLLDRIYRDKLTGIISTLVFPTAFVLLEYITVLTNPSGSYGTLAHTQTSRTLMQVMSVTGIWGLVFLITWTTSVVNWLWDHHFDLARIRKALVVFILPILLVILYGQIRLAQDTIEPTVRVASVNVIENETLHISADQPDNTNEQVNNLFLDECHTAALSGARFVFGNEIMLNVTAGEEEAFLERAESVARKDSLYIGLPLLVYPDDESHVPPMNKITWISPEGERLFTYFKAKPTPGEGHYGDGVLKYFDSPYGRIGSAICFDMDFPSLIRQAGLMNVDVMLVPGNDWVEITPYHTEVASARAIENGFNLVRSVSRGLSASYNYKGQLISSLNYYTSDARIFYSDVPTSGRHTLYTTLGDFFAWLCLAFFASVTVVIIQRTWREKRKHDASQPVT